MHKNIALVTGASSGIGRCLSIELAKNNFEVILSSRNLEKLEDTAAQIEKKGGRAYIIPADLSDIKSIESLYGKSLEIGFVGTVIMSNVSN